MRQVLAGVGHSQIGNSRAELWLVLVRVNGRRFGSGDGFGGRCRFTILLEAECISPGWRAAGKIGERCKASSMRCESWPKQLCSGDGLVSSIFAAVDLGPRGDPVGAWAGNDDCGSNCLDSH